MGQRGIYVREDDEQLWERAQRFAKSRRLTMSQTIMLALERLLEQEGEPGRRAGNDDAGT